MPKIFGITYFNYNLLPQEIPTIELTLAVEPGYNPNTLYDLDDWDSMFPGSVLIPCQWCKQWGVKNIPCLYCGGPIK